MPLRITNGFEKLSDSDLLARANNIMSGMTGNASFATPTPTLATFQTAIDAFENSLSVAQSGSNYDKAFKNEKRSAMIDVIHSLGNYVLFTANGDALVAQSSNFSIAKPPSPAPDVSQAANQQLEDGENSGTLVYSFDRVPGAKSYVYQYAPEPLTNESKWQSQTGTVKKVSFTNLDAGKRYWCRVVAIGINGQGVYSDPVSRIVQ
jgi:hypothetical protein